MEGLSKLQRKEEVDMRYGILDMPATGNLEEMEGKKETRKKSDFSPFLSTIGGGNHDDVSNNTSRSLASALEV